MIATLNRIRPYILSILRFIIGALFFCHGYDKIVLAGAWSGHPMPPPLPPMVAAAGYIEMIGGGLIALGLGTRYASFICSGQMAVAYFIGHASGGFLPIVNHGEPAVMYCFVFFYFVFSGGGPLSLDALFLERAHD